MEIGAAIGAKVVTAFGDKSYHSLAVFALISIGAAFSLVFTKSFVPVILGGFIGAFADNFIEVQTDIVLNGMIPSEQRATLISVNSFTFSVIMIALAPIFGLLFSKKST